MDTTAGGHQCSLTHCQDSGKLTLEVKHQKKTDTCWKSYRNSKESSQLTVHQVLCRETDKSRNAMSAPQLVVQSLSHVTLCDPTDCSTPGFLSFTISRRFLRLMSIESVMPSNHLIPCHPLLFLPSVFPRIRVFPSESALHHQVAKVLEPQLQHQSSQ